MKFINKLLLLGVASMALVSCEDLDTVNQGNTISPAEKEGVLNANPEMAQAGVNGISAMSYLFENVYSKDFDFGIPAIMIGLDLQGNDYICFDHGYNWFRYWEGFTTPTANSAPNNMAWYTMYNQILACNSMLESTGETPESKELKFYAAQAMATRAYNYWMLAQLFQFNPAQVGESALCVPIITEKNRMQVEKEGIGRNTVGEVYAQIYKDINGAIELIQASGLNPENLLSVKPKRMFSLAAAYGMRARVNLTLHKYAEAAQDAQSAIASFSGAPLSAGEAARPGFISLNSSNWMWGIACDEKDRVVTSGIINFPSMSCSFCSNGYVSVGAWKYANMALAEGIPGNDVRKGWFLDSDLKSVNLNKEEQDYLDEFSTIMPYTNVKFAGYKNVVGQSTNASDIPLMRIEEMYYIMAEGLAMSGHADDAKTGFENFIRKYRNPKYTMDATTPEEIQEAIYQDRRVEFWGEGLSWFDLMRLDKPVERKGLNWPDDWAFNIPSYTEDPGGKNSAVRIYLIPQTEINGNPLMHSKDNNQEGNVPTP